MMVQRQSPSAPADRAMNLNEGCRRAVRDDEALCARPLLLHMEAEDPWHRRKGKICRGKRRDHAGAMTATTLWARNALCYQLYSCILLPLDGTGMPCAQHATYCVIHATYCVINMPSCPYPRARPLRHAKCSPIKSHESVLLAKFGKIWQTLWHAISPLMTLDGHSHLKMQARI